MPGLSAAPVRTILQMENTAGHPPKDEAAELIRSRFLQQSRAQPMDNTRQGHIRQTLRAHSTSASVLPKEAAMDMMRQRQLKVNRVAELRKNVIRSASATKYYRYRLRLSAPLPPSSSMCWLCFLPHQSSCLLTRVPIPFTCCSESLKLT